MTEVVETIHHDVLSVPWRARGCAPRRTGGLSGAAYRGVRAATRFAAGLAERALAPVESWLEPGSSCTAREAFLAVLNGVLGDHLRDTGNPLALSMAFRRAGQDVEPTPEALRVAFPDASGRVVLLIHGLCQDDRQWHRNGHDHGAALARDLGITPVYLRYNTGLNISTNGRALAALLDALCAAWPVPLEELALLGYSMGGMVARSACHYGERDAREWVQRLGDIVFLGTPHHGAPMERLGNQVETILASLPYVGALARVGRLRSAGITDLRHGNLVDDHWRTSPRFARGADTRCPVPLPRARCHALAATHGRRHGDLRDRWFGDGLVHLSSALGDHDDPELRLDLPDERRWIAWGSTHLDLLDSPAVYGQILRRLAGAPPDAAEPAWREAA